METKTSGKKQHFPSGMERDTQDGKERYDLIYIPMLTRLAGLLARGASHYGDRNWEKAATKEELSRFKASAWRHFIKAMRGDKDEDHLAAIVFNVCGIMLVEAKLER